MSYADQVFAAMCRDIIENGVSTEGEKVRPIWEDTGGIGLYYQTFRRGEPLRLEERVSGSHFEKDGAEECV